MTLIERINGALDKGVDTARFERAAIALLSVNYEWLSPVESGKDIGRDADIYRVIPDDPASRGRVLATTGDPLRNLKASHRSWRKRPELRVDEIVIVCTRNVTASARQKIDAYCLTNSLPIPHYYARDWLVNALVTNGEWREYLTGIRGRVDSLSALPPKGFDESMPLVARDDLIARIRADLAEDGDIVLIGPAGVGKTRVLAGVGGLPFVHPIGRAYLTDDLFGLEPAAIAVDDAHMHLDVLAELIRLRTQEDLHYRIIASTWPEEEDKVVAMLRDCRVRAVDRLTRSELDETVRALGVTGVRARQAILDQSDGRPGWALTLTQALVRGDGQDLAVGTLAFKQVERTVRTRANAMTTLDALAWIAALNGVSDDELERIAPAVGVAPAVLSDEVRAVAVNGLLERRQGIWRFQAPLRVPLVGRWFFGPEPHRSWESLKSTFPDRRDDLIRTEFAAARLAPDQEAAHHANRWFDQVLSGGEWSAHDLTLLRSYSAVSSMNADRAAKVARGLATAERVAVTTGFGMRGGAVGDVARDVLVECAQRWFTAGAVEGLLDLAIDDRRPLTHSDHPLRILGDLVRQIDPDRGTMFELRRLLIDGVNQWMASHELSGRHWEICGVMLRYCLDPEVEGNWIDPGQIRTIMIAQEPETELNLERLVALLPEIDQLFDERSRDSAPPGTAIRELVQLLEGWLRLATGHTSGATTPSSDQRELAARGAWTILAAIKGQLDRFPGLALRAQQAIDRAEESGFQRPDALSIVLDPELVRFAGRRTMLSSSVGERIQQRVHEQRQLAQHLVELGPKAGSARLSGLVAETEVGGQSHDGHSVAILVAELADNPADWIIQAINVRSGALLQAAIRESIARGVALDREPVQRAMSDPVLRGAVVNAILNSSELDELAQVVLDGLRAEDAWSVQHLVAGKTADPIVRALLRHPVINIRTEVAIACAVGTHDGLIIPDDWIDEWSAAFLDADPGTLRQGRSRWRLEEILKALAAANPGLCTRWFERRLRHDPDAWRTISQLSDASEILRELPQDDRERMVRRSVEFSSIPNFLHFLLTGLTGDDAQLAGRMIDAGVLDVPMVFGALSGDRGRSEILAPVLLDRGVAPELIAFEMCRHGSYSGLESDLIRADIRWFGDLGARDPRLATVCRAGVRHLEGELVRVLDRERQLEIRG